jgi:hypothetical protein
LFFSPDQRRAIPLQWFEKAFGLFASYDLSPVLFTASGQDFLLDDCYLLAERGDYLAEWGEVIVARRGELVNALQNGNIEILGLDSPRPGGRDRSDWRANVQGSSSGDLYVGIDTSLVDDPSVLLRRAYEMAKGSFDVRYGIAYQSPLAQDPDCYAIGVAASTFSEVREMIRHRRERSHRKKNPDELWRDELMGEKRHLTGLYRGAYPASLLSESHLRTAALTSRGIGKLTELDASTWLWELSDSEILSAEKILESRGVLVSQMQQQCRESDP